MLRTVIQHYPGLVFLIPFGGPILFKVLVELLTGYALTVSKGGVRFIVYNRTEDAGGYWWVVTTQTVLLCFLTWFSIFYYKPN